MFSVLAIVFAGFSVTFTKKFNPNFELKYKVEGRDLMKYILMVTGCLAGTGVCGVRCSYL